MHSQSFRELLKENKFKIIIGILSLFLAKELIYITTFGNDTSPIADGYSEANSLRGAQYFVENGFTEYSGLGDLCYGDYYQESGFKGGAKKRGTTCDKFVYTHYPPGPEYLLVPAVKLCGMDNQFCIRLQPLLFNFSMAVFFCFTLFVIFGLNKGFYISLLCILPPMFHNYWHGLHQQGYQFSLLLLCSSCILLTWGKNKKTPYWLYAFYFFVGFIQGWLTFDYAFVSIFFALPFYFFFKENDNVKFMDLIFVIFFAGLGFTTAHILHFIEIINYYGSFEKAYDDLFHAANYRFNNLGVESGKVIDKSQLNPLSVAKDFLWRVAGRGKYLAINLINFVWIILFLKFVRKIEFKKSIVEFDLKKHHIWALLASIFVASLWSLTMRQHAFIHGFIARHYYLVYLFCSIILIYASKRTKKDILN